MISCGNDARYPATVSKPVPDTRLSEILVGRLPTPHLLRFEPFLGVVPEQFL